MRDWPIPFLRQKGDDKISEEELVRDLQIPVFIYRRLADFFHHDLDERIKTLFGLFLANLEPEVFCKLQGIPNLRIHGIKRVGQVRRLEKDPKYPDKPIEVVELAYFCGMTDSAVLGDIAHEMAHVFLDHNSHELCGLNCELELQADRLAEVWGFKFELQKVHQFLKERSQEDGTKPGDF